MANIQKPKGTLDVLPNKSFIWQYIESAVRKAAAKCGYGEIRFPTFEATELFNRGVGGTTDIVQKEMYTFEDKDGRSMTLRPEGTACVVRSIIENGLCMQAMPLKLYYIGSFFRYEKPQAGRSREFTQFGAELFGADSALADAELILLANDVFKSLGVKSVELKINSIGCADCRAEFRKALKDYFKSKESRLCDTCRGRLETNPLRILDCKCPDCIEVAKDAPKTVDYLCDRCKSHFEELKGVLTSAGVGYEVDPFIVRGLDYYTGTVFEFVGGTGAAQSTVCGGGRYDTLVSQLGGPALSGVGFGMGITRLMAVMELDGVLPKADTAPDIYIAPACAAARDRAYLLAKELRDMGLKAESDLCGRSLKAQMKWADKAGAAYTLVLGDSEIEAGRAVLKPMRGGEAAEVAVNAAEIKNAILKGNGER